MYIYFVGYDNNVQRTSDSLNEGLPIKLPEKSFEENDIFSMKKRVGSTIDLSTKAVFSLDKYQLKKYGLKTPFLLFNI